MNHKKPELREIPGFNRISTAILIEVDVLRAIVKDTTVSHVAVATALMGSELVLLIVPCEGAPIPHVLHGQPFTLSGLEAAPQTDPNKAH